MRMKIILAFCFISLWQNASALKCYVGQGNSSIALPTDEEGQKAHEESQGRDTVFKILECGKKNSELNFIDQLRKNVTDQIQKGLSGLTNKAKEALSRRKRDNDDDDDDSNHACIKITRGGTTSRSCVPKIGNIKLNCTSAVGGKLAVCYCHDDNCNGAEKMNAGLSIATAILALALFGAK